MARPTWKSVVQKVGGTLEIEQVVEHRLFLMALVRVIAILIRAVRIPAAVIIIVITSLAFGRLVGAVDDLIQFAAVEPDAPALRTIIDFNALAVGNYQDDITLWTFHSETGVKELWMVRSSLKPLFPLSCSRSLRSKLSWRAVQFHQIVREPQDNLKKVE